MVLFPDRKYSGEELLQIANEWTGLDEVLFATPNFVSQYWRQAKLPRIPTVGWHLVNKGTGGAKKDEDVDVREAWKITRGKRSVVVAVLDDGVDIEPEGRGRCQHGHHVVREPRVESVVRLVTTRSTPGTDEMESWASATLITLGSTW